MPFGQLRFFGAGRAFAPVYLQPAIASCGGGVYAGCMGALLRGFILSVRGRGGWLVVLGAGFSCCLNGAVWIKGGDVSSLAKGESLGGVYRTAGGTRGDALAILAGNGMNLVRLRVWVASPDGFHGAADILPMARRAHALGLRLLLTFHYSDTWADPAQQTKPAAWAALSAADLRAAVYDHTYALCAALAAQGTPADYVEVGNEINDGLLWPEGRLSTQGYAFSALAPYLQSGIAAVRAASPTTAVVLHIAQGGNWDTVRWWFDGVKGAGVAWDYIGLSYYPYWHGTLTALESTVTQAAAYFQKPVLICETAYPFTLNAGDSQGNVIGLSTQLTAGYAATATGQAAMLRAIFDILDRVPAGRGAGVVYWDATWTVRTGNGWNNLDATSGNNWENQALFDYTGRALAAQTVFAELPALAAPYFSARDMAEPAVCGDLADPDGDGAPNLLELALAADPRAAANRPAVTSQSLALNGDTYLSLVYRRPSAAAGIDYRVFTATTPAGPWLENAIAVGTPVIDGAAQWCTCRGPTPLAPAAGAPAAQFMRIGVTRVPALTLP